MTMESRKVIRAELQKFRDESDRLAERKAVIDGKADALEQALRALTGKGEVNNEEPAKAKYRRTFKGRKTREEREHEVLDVIRSANRMVGAAEVRSLSREAGEEIPHSTAQAAINRLLAQGKVRQMGTTGRGQPKVGYVEAKVTPGEGIAHGTKED